MRPRAKKAIKIGAALILAGCAYAVFVTCTGLSVPCPFRLITGLKCPGCGVTHMLLDAARFDFAGAFRANRVLFCALPLLAALLCARAVRYVRSESAKPCRFERAVTNMLLIVLLAWGVVRNFTGL